MGRTGHWPRMMGLLLGMVVALVGVTVPAGPAAAQAAAPQCQGWVSSNGLFGEGGCSGGDAAIPYRVVMMCRQYIEFPNDPLYEYFTVSAWAPTTQRITGVSCVWGGYPALVFTEVAAPPPPPGANIICESGANSFFCHLEHGLSGVVQIRWTINGMHLASWDNQTYVSSGCSSGTVIAVTVTNSAGSATDSWRNCRSGPWQ